MTSNDEPTPDGRGTEHVLEDHLRLRKQGDLDADLERNYHPGVVTISAEGVHHGHEAVRHLAGILRFYAPDGRYRYHWLRTDGDIGMLRWSALDDRCPVHDGADTFVVRDGRIVAQTIHYSA